MHVSCCTFVLLQFWYSEVLWEEGVIARGCNSLSVRFHLSIRRTQEAVVVSEEKIQQRSCRRGHFCSSRFRAGKSVRNFPAASKFARKLLQQGILDSDSLLEFSESNTMLHSKSPQTVSKFTNLGTTPITILAGNSDHGLS